MKRFKTILLILSCIGLCTTVRSQPSVFNTGKWFRVAVTENGVYKITAEQLTSMGFNTATLDPRNIRIYGSGGGMLPQQNDLPRSGLTETAIHVQGEEDGKFNNGDFILFYGEGPDRASFDAARTIYSCESNLYSDRNFYFVTVAESAGKRLQTSINENGSYPLLTQYDDYWYHESDEVNFLNSGREWFGERFDLGGERVFNLPLSGIPADGTIKIVSDVVIRSHPSASLFDIYMNSQLVGQQSVAATPDPMNKYSLQGRHRRDTLTLSATDV
ncbi:MAG TPA: hypothetical protein VD816_12700, partial [Ohtaekwangia sp.]|nr:hypothetical protein [Ohtaekwangia sp.]